MTGFNENQSPILVVVAVAAALDGSHGGCRTNLVPGTCTQYM